MSDSSRFISVPPIKDSNFAFTKKPMVNGSMSPDYGKETSNVKVEFPAYLYPHGIGAGQSSSTGVKSSNASPKAASNTGLLEPRAPTSAAEAKKLLSLKPIRLVLKDGDSEFRFVNVGGSQGHVLMLILEKGKLDFLMKVDDLEGPDALKRFGYKIDTDPELKNTVTQILLEFKEKSERRN